MSGKLEVRINENLRKKLDKKSRALGLTKSEIVRYLLAYHLDDVPMKSDIEKLSRELSAIGNNLNQIAKQLNSLGMNESTREQVSHLFKEAIKSVYELNKKLSAHKK